MFESPVPLNKRGRFRSATVGGTFEGLHLGHQRYLELAMHLADTVHVSITSQRFAQTYKPYPVSSFADRRARIHSFFEESGGPCRVEFHELEGWEKLEAYAIGADVDLAVVERSYLPHFEAYNWRRRQLGVAEYCILLKPRTVLDDQELSASGLDASPGS